MKNLYVKRRAMYLTLLLGTSGLSYADTVSVEAASNGKLTDKPSIVSCPSEFQQVKISHDARQCQAFDEPLTAVMVYHSPAAPEAMVELYQTAHPDLTAHSPISGRTLLSSKDKAIRVIVSPDKTGSQVDILVTSNDK